MEQKSGGRKPRSRFPDGFRIMQGRQEYVTYIEHASLRVWYSETPWQYDTHYHSAVEIIMPLRGEVIYQLAERVYRVQADELLIVPPNCVHSLAMYEGSARYLLLFEPDSLFGMRDMAQLGDFLRKPIYLSGMSELQQRARQLIEQCVSCYEQREFLWNSMCHAYLLQLYVLLGRQCAEPATPAGAEAHRMDPEIIDSARQYIDQNFQRSLTLEEVSDFTGFSKYYFSRTFKQRVGTSFSEYLRRVRVRAAQELLVHSRRSIREIAADAGFGSVATFNRVFREACSCSPSRYREIYGDIT